MRTLCFAILTFFVFSGTGQNTMLVKQYQDKVKLYLDKENALGGYYSIDTSGITIYESPEKRLKQLAEFKVYWVEVNLAKQKFRDCTSEELLQFLKGKKSSLFGSDSFKIKEPFRVNFSPLSDSPLKGLRIAIDPGHLANDIEMAKMEKKFIEIKANSASGLQQPVQLIESQLTFETASLLKKKLERAGAQVMLSRSKDTDFDRWYTTSFRAEVDSEFIHHDITKEEKQFFLQQATKKDILRKIYVNIEMKERARKINLFKPDFTVIIHYNVDEKNIGWKKPTTKDFDMAFTGGSYMKNEMKKPAERAEFLRLLLTDDIENSIRFSSFFIKSFERNLQVPTAKSGDADYLTEYCLPTEEPGVFCRNLIMTRLVHGTLVYGETLFQDNLKELQLLSEPGRVQQVAAAYYEGVTDYVKNVLH